MRNKGLIPIFLVLLQLGILCYSAELVSSNSQTKLPLVTSQIGYWQPTSMVNTLAGRYGHTVVWTGNAALFWGGYYAVDHFMNDGRLYYPITDTWVSISTVNAPVGRLRHTAVWTGDKMLVWGGESGSFSATTNTGGIYSPETDTWIPITTTNAPSAREMHSAVWTGTEMIVWGGCSSIFCTQVFSDGGRYNPTTDTWTPISGTGLIPRNFHQAIWTGNRMIVWGGTNNPQGMSYDPTTDTWTPLAIANAPTPTYQGAGVWTGYEMIVWGGCTNHTTTPCVSYINTGGRYNPSTDTWSPITLVGAPAARWTHSGVWTGQRMIVWGGCGTQCYNNGGVYDPLTDTWIALNTTDAPIPRSDHKAVWTGMQMLVWGGCDSSGCENANYYATGGKFSLYVYFLPVIMK